MRSVGDDRYLDDLSPFAVAGLARFALDQLWQAEDEGCCPTCCDPCGALRDLLDAGVLDRLLAVSSGATGSSWWVDGKVDRAWLARAWRRTDCHDEEPEPA